MEALGIANDTFYALKKESCEFSEILTKGRKETREKIIGNAIKKAESDTYMSTFMLKNKCGYMEEQQSRSITLKEKDLQLKEMQFKLQQERFIAEVAEKAGLNKQEILEILIKHGITNAIN